MKGMQDIGIPIAALVAAPLEAASEAQKQLALSTADFISKIGMKKDEDGKTSLQMVEFSFERPVETHDGIVRTRVEAQAPLLSLVPMPSLAVEEVSVDFQMEVTECDAVMDKATGTERAGIKGQITSSASKTRETNQSAKYQFHVVAKKQDPTEALGRLLDILATGVAPNGNPTELRTKRRTAGK